MHMRVVTYYPVLVFLTCIWISPSLVASDEDFDILKILEGRWEWVESNKSGMAKVPPNVVDYVRSGSSEALYGDIGLVSIVYRREPRIGMIYRTEIVCRPAGVNISILVGRVDQKTRMVEWFEGSLSGPRKLVWKLRGDDEILVEMDKAWVKNKIRELRRSSIPRDQIDEQESDLIMKRIREK